VASEKREALKDACLTISDYADQTIERHDGKKTDDFEAYSWKELFEMLDKEMEEVEVAAEHNGRAGHTVAHELGDMLTVMGMILKKHWRER
jgi:hypothetical protein